MCRSYTYTESCCT